MGCVPSLFEVQLVTNDLDRLGAFYEEVFGLAVTLRDTARQRVHFALGEGQLILAADGFDVVAAPWPGLPAQLFEPDDDLVAGPQATGPVHFALGARRPYRDGVLERARSRGVPVRGPHTWPGGLASWYLLDPDGNCPELIGAVDADE